MRFGRMLFTAVTALVVAGCGGSGGSGTESAPLEFHDGFAKLGVPLGARRDAAVVAVGSQVVVFGGHRRESSSRTRWLDDGAVYDTDAEGWRPMAPAPFERAPYSPSVVGTGDRLVVVGTPCGTASSEMEQVECPGQRPEVASYDPVANTWTDPVPLRFTGDLADLGARADRYGFPLSGGELGWAGGRAVIGLEEGRVIGVAVDGATVLVPPAPGTGVPCLQGGRLFAFGAAESLQAFAAAGEAQVHTWEWTEAGGWVEAPGPMSGGIVVSDRVLCPVSAAARVAVGHTGAPVPVEWFDPADAAWTLLPSLVPQDTITDPNVGESPRWKLIWIADRLYRLGTGDTTWTEVDSDRYDAAFPYTFDPMGLPEAPDMPRQYPPRLVPVGRLVVTVPDRTEEVAPALGVLDPAAIPAES